MPAAVVRVLLAMGLALPGISQPADALLEEQRMAFRAAYGEAERGNWEGLLPYLTLVADYVLYPDLEGRALRATLANQKPARLYAFLAAHPGHPERRLIADQWLRHLAGREDWSEFRAVWQRHPPPQPDSELACHGLRARLLQGADEDLITAALARWQVGFSQPKSCDPLFALLRERGLLTPERYAARLDMALQQRQFGLASYLARHLNGNALERVTRWQQVYSDPGSALVHYPHNAQDVDERQQALTGLLRLAYQDGAQARRTLERLKPHYALSASEHAAILRRIALGKARRHEPDAFTALDRVPRNARDATIVEWQLRAALRGGLWGEALGVFHDLADAEARSDEWQYWLARSREAVGDQAGAQQIYAALAQHRSLYGFLSADRQSLPYAFDHRPTVADEARLQRLAADPQLKRARELFLVGLFGRGRTLWEQTVQAFDKTDQAQAALLADRWGWHSRAISTATRAGLKDDLQLRYPLPRVNWTQRLASNARIDEPFALGVTRSESLFMPDVRSSAGAVGLMQLMPATGRQVARSLNLPYRGLATLTDPDSNVRLGTAYLEQMLDRFAENKVLATAAYNAGPHRVEAWLPEAPLPADVWMDSIPFTETRRYVRRVLESEAIVYWRLTGRINPVSNIMRPVEPTRRGSPQGAGSS